MLIAGVGYRNLRDLSVGPVLMDRLGQVAWPYGVEVEDLSYGPVGVMHTLDARPLCAHHLRRWGEAPPAARWRLLLPLGASTARSAGGSGARRGGRYRSHQPG